MVFKLIFYYIFYCLRFRIAPWRYLKINIEYYNNEKGYYSKIDNDKLIPSKWRLQQDYLKQDKIPQDFPVFIKPEWGQNSHGVCRIDTKQEFIDFPAKKTKIPLIVQNVARQKNEYEIFYIRDSKNNKKLAILSISKVDNVANIKNPINGIKNKHTAYVDITQNFSSKQLQQIKKILQQLPPFRIARVGIKANSIDGLLSEIFSIIEINLFAPFPLGLLDVEVSNKEKNIFIKKSMFQLAKVSATTIKSGSWLKFFLRKVIKNYQAKYNL